MTSVSTAANWREDLLKLSNEIGPAVDGELAKAREVAREDGARAAAETLNQGLRRMRQAPGSADLLSALLESSTSFSRRAVIATLDGARGRCSLLRGFVAPNFSFDLSAAAAVMTAIETKDPVVAAASEGELSPELYQAITLDLEVSERCYLFPLIAGGSVRSVLFALGGVEPAALELLAEAAGLRLELLEAAGRTAPQPARTWTDLPPADQAIHLKAQRFARVAVAEMRMTRAAAVREGQERGALYDTLRPEMDSARERFREEFVKTTPTMVDYLYLELVRSLANENDRLLGPNFPGRLV